MVARSLSSGVLSSVAAALVARPVAPAPFVLPASLAALPGVSVSAPVEVLGFRFTTTGVVCKCSDGFERTCRWATVERFRGKAASVRAQEWFLGHYHPMTYETSTWRFVAVGGWDCNEWFAAVVRC